MRTDELDFELPPDRIATAAAEPRDAARLMVVHRDSGKIEHARVRDLPGLGIVAPGDLMAVNQTRVLPAYLTGVRTQTGGKVTGLFVQIVPGTHSDHTDGETWDVMLESRGKLQPGEHIDLVPGRTDQDTPDAAVAQLELLEPRGRGEWRARVTSDGPTDPPTLLGRVGQTPLPPYIRKARQARQQPEVPGGDAQRYNTVFAEPAEAAASVAAPTAGLHFTPELLAGIDGLGVRRVPVTLHVGLGTFLPVQTDTLEDHPIHSEWIDVPRETLEAIRQTRDAGRSILAVGTTTVRCLESLPASLEGLDGFTDDTELFITPDRVASGDFTYRFTDHLLTNFHLPKSTLLAMVAALPGVGLPRLLDWYRQAITDGYRFYSFGDAMLIV
ncbi:MAG: tRNA preQ1(34) S-adenosylmethionine ribosyltransferase-isomerase QueA [Planctomycetota bacterium]